MASGIPMACGLTIGCVDAMGSSSCMVHDGSTGCGGPIDPGDCMS